MVPNIYIQQLRIHSGEEKNVKNKMKQKKLWHNWPHLEFHSIFNQAGTNPHLKKKKSAVWRAKGTDKKRGKLYIRPSPTEVFQTCSLTKMFRMYDFKGRSLCTKKLLAFLTSEELWQKGPFFWVLNMVQESIFWL